MKKSGLLPNCQNEGDVPDGNNRGGINGWITRKAIYGVVTEIV